jgi:uncharacterized protein (TIGR03083 family)
MSISGPAFSASRQAVSSSTGGLDPYELWPVMPLPHKSCAGPGTISFVEIADHIEALREQGTQLADAASRAGLDAAVPPCSPWLVKDLLRHTGYVHRWAARHVNECPPRVLDGPAEDEILTGGAPDAGLISWFLTGHAALVQALTAADPGLECATLMPASSPLAFWARRQAHETAIHRADADTASGALPQYAPDFAADGVDELITGFGQRRKYRPSPGHGGTLRVRTTDTRDAWYLSEEEGRIHAHRGAGEPAGSSDCVVSGPASGLYLFLWNRAGAIEAGVTVSGDSAVLASWQSSVRVRWD